MLNLDFKERDDAYSIKFYKTYTNKDKNYVIILINNILITNFIFLKNITLDKNK